MSEDLTMSDPSVEFSKIYALLTEIQQDNRKLHQDNMTLQQHIIQLCEVQSIRTIPTVSQPKSLKVSLPDKFDGNRQNF